MNLIEAPSPNFDPRTTIPSLLVLLDADSPETLHALGLGMVVAFVCMVGVDLRNAQSEKR